MYFCPKVVAIVITVFRLTVLVKYIIASSKEKYVAVIFCWFLCIT